MKTLLKGTTKWLYVYLIAQYRSSYIQGLTGFFLLVYVLYSTLLHLLQIALCQEDAGIEPRTVATLALAVRRSNHSIKMIVGWIHRHGSHLLTWLWLAPSTEHGSTIYMLT
jgi:hypothetical protein